VNAGKRSSTRIDGLYRTASFAAVADVAREGGRAKGDSRCSTQQGMRARCIARVGEALPGLTERGRNGFLPRDHLRLHEACSTAEGCLLGPRGPSRTRERFALFGGAIDCSPASPSSTSSRRGEALGGWGVVRRRTRWRGRLVPTMDAFQRLAGCRDSSSHNNICIQVKFRLPIDHHLAFGGKS
jgi:hypothetical protein